MRKVTDETKERMSEGQRRRHARERAKTESELARQNMIGKMVRLSEAGLAARGLTDRGFDQNTRGVVMRGLWPAKNVLSVLVNGADTPETWGSWFWEIAE